MVMLDSREQYAFQPGREPGHERQGSRSWLFSPGVLAVLSWLVLTPVAMAVPGWFDANPLTKHGVMLPIAAAGLLVSVLVPLGRLPVMRRFITPATGIACGCAAAWVALALRSALHGTPYGFGGLFNDAGRFAAQATRYATTLHSADHFVPSVPNDYPPLFQWLVGRSSTMFGGYAWELIGAGQCLLVSLSVLIGFLLWRKIVREEYALVATIVSLVPFAEPHKPFVIFSIVVFAPWVILVFGLSNRGSLHWIPAGLLGGVMVLLFYGPFMYASAGLLFLAVRAMRTTESRRGLVSYLLRVAGLMLVVSSWFLVPYASYAMEYGMQVTVIRYVDTNIQATNFPFMEFTPLGALQMCGLAGVLWFRRAVDWAYPLLCLILGCYAYRLVTLFLLIEDGLNRQVSYPMRLIGPILAAAGVLTLCHATPALLRRLKIKPQDGSAALVLTLIVLWASVECWRAWMPSYGTQLAAYDDHAMQAADAPVDEPNQALNAFLEPLQDGNYPEHAPKPIRRPFFPATNVLEEVQRIRGPEANPVTLSFDERLFSFVRWPGYMGVSSGSANGLVRWDDRLAEVRELEQISDPKEFAERSAHTAFGPIDLFVLKRMEGGWTMPLVWPETSEIRFRQTQFGAPYFRSVNLREDVVIVLRR